VAHDASDFTGFVPDSSLDCVDLVGERCCK
jgi:hypothetical protein